MSKIKDFMAANGLKVSPRSKAGVLLAAGGSDKQIAVALMNTKAYKESSELRYLCDEIWREILEPTIRLIRGSEKKSDTDKSAEPRYGW